MPPSHDLPLDGESDRRSQGRRPPSLLYSSRCLNSLHVSCRQCRGAIELPPRCAIAVVPTDAFRIPSLVTRSTAQESRIEFMEGTGNSQIIRRTSRPSWVLSLDGDKTPSPFLVSPFFERAGRGRRDADFRKHQCWSYRQCACHQAKAPRPSENVSARERGRIEWLGRLARPSRNDPSGGVVTTNCAGGGGGGDGLKFHTATPMRVPPTAKVASANGIACRQCSRSEVPVGPVGNEPRSAIHVNSSRRSWAECHRSSGSFARHFFTTRSSIGGVTGWRFEIAGGSASRIAAIKLAWLPPSNALLPVTIS